MYNYRPAAAVHRLTFNFDFTITAKREYGGYKVVSGCAASTKGGVEAGAAAIISAPETTAEAAAPDAAPTHRADTNGLSSDLLELIAPDV